MAGILFLVLILDAYLTVPGAASDLSERSASQATIEASIHDAGTPHDPALAKRLSTLLVEAVERHEARRVQGVAGPEERYHVYVHLEPGRSTHLLEGLLPGIVNRDESNALVTARVTPTELRVLASLDGVRRVREVVPPRTGAMRPAAGDGDDPRSRWISWVAANGPFGDPGDESYRRHDLAGLLRGPGRS
ncbi:MAG: hypothetical protein GXY82_06165 [Methanospirillum sp.]|nr:hypothetical protein [Methanospirillum sp.]